MWLFCCSLYLVCVLIVVSMGRWSEFSVCIVCQVVRPYSVVSFSAASAGSQLFVFLMFKATYIYIYK